MYDHFPETVRFILRNFENKFIMNLQYHCGTESLPFKPFVNAYHGNLYNIRCRTLNGGIDGIPLGIAPDHLVG